jgi:hypothetical protein
LTNRRQWYKIESWKGGDSVLPLVLKVWLLLKIVVMAAGVREFWALEAISSWF